MKIFVEYAQLRARQQLLRGQIFLRNLCIRMFALAPYYFYTPEIRANSFNPYSAHARISLTLFEGLMFLSTKIQFSSMYLRCSDVAPPIGNTRRSLELWILRAQSFTFFWCTPNI